MASYAPSRTERQLNGINNHWHVREYDKPDPKTAGGYFAGYAVRPARITVR